MHKGDIPLLRSQAPIWRDPEEKLQGGAVTRGAPLTHVATQSEVVEYAVLVSFSPEFMFFSAPTPIRVSAYIRRKYLYDGRNTLS